MLDKQPFSSHPLSLSLSLDPGRLRWKMMPGGRRRHAEQVTAQPRSLPETTSQARFTVESHTADGVQGSELAPRGHVHTQQMGGEEETKKLGEKKKKKMNDTKAEQPRWRVEGGGGTRLCTGSFVCLLACVCAFCWPTLASAKFTGLLTAITPIHRLITRRQISFVTLLILIIIEHVLCKAKLFKHANLCFCFPGEKAALSLAEAEGEGASSAERKRVRQRRNRKKKKIISQGCIPLPVSDVMFFFLFQCFPVRLNVEPWHLIRTCYTGDKRLFRKQRKTAAICFETGGKLKCLVKVISQCQWFRNGLWNVNKGGAGGKKKGNIT